MHQSNLCLLFRVAELHDRVVHVDYARICHTRACVKPQSILMSHVVLCDGLVHMRKYFQHYIHTCVHWPLTKRLSANSNYELQEKIIFMELLRKVLLEGSHSEFFLLRHCKKEHVFSMSWGNDCHNTENTSLKIKALIDSD